MEFYAAQNNSTLLTKRIHEERTSNKYIISREPYQRDRDRIIHSRAFRRMMHKTQVFNANKGDHYRNRLTHTLEVSQIARSIGKYLQLNDELIEAVVSRFFRKFISSASKYRNQIYGFSSSFGCSISILNRCSMSI